MTTLWDIEQLLPLEAMTRRHGVTFKLRGGVAYRLALAQQTMARKMTFDLFELTRFTSDVDLMHSGSPDLTQTLLEEILATVPEAECFRWELRAEREVKATFLAANSNLVPARLIEVSGQVPEGLLDPAGGVDDIHRGNYRYSPNPFFRQSTLYRTGRDLEAFSALLYLQTLAEVGLPPLAHENQYGWREVSGVFRAGLTDPEIVRLLQEHAYLRSRMRHLLLATAAAYEKRADFLDVAKRSGLTPFVHRLAVQTHALPLEESLVAFFAHGNEPPFLTFVESDRLKGDTYRMRMPEGPWLPLDLSDLKPPNLAEHQEVLLVSPEMFVEPGTAQGFIGSLGAPQASPTLSQEFVLFELPEAALADNVSQSPVRGLRDEDISAFLMLRDQSQAWTPVALPAVVTRKVAQAPVQRDRLAVRMNGLGSLETAAGQKGIAARVVIVGWRPGLP